MMTRAILAATAAVIAALTPASVAADTNPFAPFFGEWTLKGDLFQQVWDGKTVQTQSIPNHHTTCRPVNTEKSVFCVVSAGELKGHILWVIDEREGVVRHLSHFGSERLGVGKGALSTAGDLRLRLNFSDEPSGTYRVYDYNWHGPDEYYMISRQYSRDGRPTGNWYGGTFVRMKSQP